MEPRIKLICGFVEEIRFLICQGNTISDLSEKYNFWFVGEIQYPRAVSVPPTAGQLTPILTQLSLYGEECRSSFTRPHLHSTNQRAPFLHVIISTNGSAAPAGSWYKPVCSWTQISCSWESSAEAPRAVWNWKKNLKSDLKDGLCAEVAIKVEQQFLNNLLEPEAEADNNKEGDGEGGEGGEADADGDLCQGVLGVESRRARCLVFRLGNRPRCNRLHPALAEPTEADIVATPTTLAAAAANFYLFVVGLETSNSTYLPRVSTVINIFNRHFFTTISFSLNQSHPTLEWWAYGSSWSVLVVGTCIPSISC